MFRRAKPPLSNSASDLFRDLGLLYVDDENLLLHPVPDIVRAALQGEYILRCWRF